MERISQNINERLLRPVPQQRVLIVLPVVQLVVVFFLLQPQGWQDKSPPLNSSKTAWKLTDLRLRWRPRRRAVKPPRALEPVRKPPKSQWWRTRWNCVPQFLSNNCRGSRSLGSSSPKCCTWSGGPRPNRHPSRRKLEKLSFPGRRDKLVGPEGTPLHAEVRAETETAFNDLNLFGRVFVKCSWMKWWGRLRPHRATNRSGLLQVRRFGIFLEKGRREALRRRK